MQSAWTFFYSKKVEKISPLNFGGRKIDKNDLNAGMMISALHKLLTKY